MKDSMMLESKPITLHQRIQGDLERKIVSGEWPPGFRIPFEVDLAESYNCSRMTVNKVLTQLAAAGLIERRRKSGSVVSQPKVQSAVLEIPDIRAEIESLHADYTYQLLSSRTRPYSATDGDKLNIAAGT